MKALSIFSVIAVSNFVKNNKRNKLNPLTIQLLSGIVNIDR